MGQNRNSLNRGAFYECLSFLPRIIRVHVILLFLQMKALDSSVTEKKLSSGPKEGRHAHFFSF